MALQFYPRAGQILVCDFKGFVPPEMVKIRPVVVVSPRLPYRSDIVAIVPLSTTAPRHALPFCVQLSRNYVPNDERDIATWAKCDMVINICTNRLSAFKIGRRKYTSPTMTAEDFAAVRHGILCGLGLDNS